MKRLDRIKGKLSFILISGILILCIAFTLIACGNAELKGVNPDAGQFAIDFTDCSGTICRLMFPIDIATAVIRPVAGKPLTAEAWVKTKPTSTPVTGSVVGRIGPEGGLALIVKNNVPKFLIRQLGGPGGSSTDRIVTSSTSIIAHMWTHLAGVLSKTVHDDVTDHTVSAQCLAGVGAEMPHLDFYVNGKFTGCATTASQFASSPLIQSEGIGVHGESGIVLDGSITDTVTPFVGIIDEVRLWNVERSAAQINACMNTELGLSGNCSYVNSGMISYARMNEGKGISAGDRAGIGSGIKLIGAATDWIDGWTLDAAPITKVK